MSKAPDLNGKSHEQVCAELNARRIPVSVAIFGSLNEFNIGGMIRASHNFTVKEIHLVEVEWFYKKGALSTLKYERDVIRRWPTLEEFIAGNRTRNIVALEKRDGLDSKDLRSYVWPDNPILFFGSEKTGVPDVILEAAKDIVSIPMMGLNNDHNVTSALAISLYDFYFKHTTLTHTNY